MLPMDDLPSHPLRPMNKEMQMCGKNKKENVNMKSSKERKSKN